MNATELRRAIEARDAVVAVIGLGYVGLPIAVAFAEAGFRVIGVDLDEQRLREINDGRSYLHDLPSEQIGPLIRSERLRATSSYEELRAADAILICVDTPLSEGTPDLSSVVAVGQSVGKVLKRGALVILESTTYPGTTEEILRPLLEYGGLVAGEDFLLAYSPERIDPGNLNYHFSDIPKVVGGVNEASTTAAESLYQQVVPKVVTVSGTREAELAKLIENTFRHVNIALVNELAVYAHEMGVDIWEAIEAAATKPFGFMPFWPGPGWGGHCIPLDPAYLSYRVRRDREHEARFVELAHAVNSEMPRYVVERITLLLNDCGKSVKGARVLGVGIAYKGGTEDTRGSPAMKVLSTLAKRGALVSYHDPLVPSVELNGDHLASVPLTDDSLAATDLVVVLAKQADVDWETVAQSGTLTLDCCNALAKKGSGIVRL